MIIDLCSFKEALLFLTDLRRSVKRRHILTAGGSQKVGKLAVRAPHGKIIRPIKKYIPPVLPYTVCQRKLLTQQARKLQKLFSSSADLNLYRTVNLLICDLSLLCEGEHNRIPPVLLRREDRAFISRRLHPEPERDITRRRKHPFVGVIREYKLHIQLIRK